MSSRRLASPRSRVSAPLDKARLPATSRSASVLPHSSTAPRHHNWLRSRNGYGNSLGLPAGGWCSIGVLDGEARRYPAAMCELAGRKPDVLVAPGPEVSLEAARSATQTIPIVMVGVDYDPLARGYVKSLAHPGGNITGIYL